MVNLTAWQKLPSTLKQLAHCLSSKLPNNLPFVPETFIPSLFLIWGIFKVLSQILLRFLLLLQSGIQAQASMGFGEAIFICLNYALCSWHFVIYTWMEKVWHTAAQFWIQWVEIKFGQFTNHFQSRWNFFIPNYVDYVMYACNYQWQFLWSLLIDLQG